MKVMFRNKWMILFFVILFLFGISNTGEYGRPIDERPEQEILLMNIKEYAATVGINLHDSAFNGINRISESVEMDHGIAAYYLFTPILMLTGRETMDSMYAWHIYTYIIWFLGLIALYSVLRSVCNSKWTPIIGVLIYFFTPRMYAEGHYNNKDIVLLSIVLMMLACFCKLLKRGKTRDVVFYSVASGFLMNSKIVGVAIWGMTGVFAIGYVLLMSDRKDRRKKLADLTLAAVLSLLIFFILTPAMWRFPMGYIEYCLQNGTGFSRWSKSFLFNGEVITPAETGIPGTYLIQWILMTTPVYVIILFLTSVGFFIKDIRIKNKTKEDRQQQFFYLLFMTTFILPILVSIIKAPTLVLYNGWRHNYYLFAYVILCSCYTVDHILKGFKPDARLVITGIAVIGFLWTGVEMLINRSFEYMYFNPLARIMMDVEGFEGDYWNVAVLPAMKEFASENAEEKISIAPKGYAADNQLKNIEFDTFRLVQESDNADYCLFNTSMMIKKDELEGYEKLYSFRRYGRELCAIFCKKE